MPEEHKKLHPAAFRELKAGETYDPIVPASQSTFEITIRSVAIGLVMAVIFSLASAYLALKAGQGMEPAIPIAILAVGMAGLFARRSTILENVIIQSIGAASGARWWRAPSSRFRPSTCSASRYRSGRSS